MNPRRPSVLAVDDQPANLIALEAVLSREYNLINATSGQAAIDVLTQRQDIDVILMDVQMPGMDGFDAVARIKQIAGCAEIPIIFITAIYREDPFVKKGYAVGAVDYFAKPFDPDILRLKVGIYSSFRRKLEVLQERERQLRESEELLAAGRKLSSLLENLPVGVLIADVQGRICQSNEELSRIYGATEPIARDSYGEILGWWGADGQSLKEKDGALQRALAGTASRNQVVRVRSFDGADKVVLCSASPLKALDGAIVGAVVVIQDVTESKEIEQALERRITRLVTLGLELEQQTAKV